jgi:hypothetical protein
VDAGHGTQQGSNIGRVQEVELNSEVFSIRIV